MLGFFVNLEHSTFKAFPVNPGALVRAVSGAAQGAGSRAHQDA
jgi:hypothetical protein